MDDGKKEDGMAEEAIALTQEGRATAPRVVVSRTPTVGKLTAALAAAQAEFEPPRKTKTAKVRMKEGGEYTYSYADLADVIAAVRGPLAAHGIAWTQDAMASRDNVSVTTHLWHGDEHLSFGPFVLAIGGTHQAAGSALTYARRYALSAALGIASEADDDAQLAQAGTVKDRSRTASEAAMKRLHALAAQKGVTHEQLHDWAGANLGVESLTELTVNGAKAMMESLEGLPDAGAVHPEGEATAPAPETTKPATAAKATWDEAVALIGSRKEVVDWYREHHKVTGSLAIKNVTEEGLRAVIDEAREVKS